MLGFNVNVLNEISDIISVKKIDESEVMESIEEGNKEVERVANELITLDKYEAAKLEKTKEDLANMRMYISDIKAKLIKDDISIGNFDIKSLEDMKSYQALHDGIYDKEKEGKEELDRNSIEEMPIAAIEMKNQEAQENLSGNASSMMDDAIGKLKNDQIDRQEYLDYVESIEKFEESDEISDTIVKHLQTIRGGTARSFTEDFVAEIVTQVGGNPEESAKIINDLLGTKDPEKTLSFLSKHGSKLQKGGIVVKSILGPLGLTLGMYEDVYVKEKTPGEAYAHNITGLGVGAAPSVIYTALVGAPTGWAALGLAAGGFGLFYSFEWGYETNFLGMQTGLDATGNFLQGGFELMKESYYEMNQGVIGESFRQNAENMQDMFLWYE